MPDVEASRTTRTPGHHCQYASTVDGEDRWADVPVSVGERGVAFDNDRSSESS
ncbi:hypothetical protein [Streptomyces coelicoflavus]|uniref:hypothetical protein n=1 Tax=Streptomyces coelicoflavus TaxID=285562 RepID=UPI002E2677C3